MFQGRNLMGALIAAGSTINFAQYNGYEQDINFGIFTGRGIAVPGINTIGDFVSRIQTSAEEIASRSDARTTAYAATYGSGVVLLPAFFGLDANAQRNALIHEGIHVAFQSRSDVFLARRLALPGSANWSVGNGEHELEASESIQGWINRGCK